MTYSWSGPASAASEVVWLALSDSGGAYAEAAEAARREIQHTGATVEVQPWQQLLGPGRTPPQLVVAVGSSAFAGLADSELRAPLLATLLPRAAFERHAERAGRNGRAVSAVFLDQPLTRLLDLLRLALPERRRVGVMFGPESKHFGTQLRAAMAQRGMALASAETGVGGHLFPAMQELIADADLLLALPDPYVYNSLTIQNILTATYRRRIPLIGFSPAYIKAGAMLALYSTPAQVGAQTGDIARAVLVGRALPAPQVPREFSIGVNADVARSLGIAVDAGAAEKWSEQLRLKERAP